ncbi:Bystin family protein [Aphelenchoides besseyi]|nr:Bystin family protein [Aphelenchoides besseyi]
MESLPSTTHPTSLEEMLGTAPEDSNISEIAEDSMTPPSVPQPFVAPETPAPMDPTKLAELRRSCIKNCSEVNRDYQHSRQTERRFYYDSQTSVVQCPAKRAKVQVQEARSPLYPVALHPMQFQETVKIFPADALRRLPLNTVLDTSHLFPPKREASPLPIRVTDEELLRQERAIAALEKTKQEVVPVVIPEPQTPKTSRGPGRRSNAEKNAMRTCSFCKSCDEGDSLLERLLRCCQCQTHMHAKCLDMSLEMIRVVRAYSWCCADCKKCTDAMMCCDSCDRGYHTHCVGLTEIPSGTWRFWMSSASGTTDIGVKYQRLATEFVKLRSQVGVLKNAIVEEQEKTARQRDELHEKETEIRKVQVENEGLLFRNCQLVKRVEALQQSLEDVTKMHAAKGKKKQKEANLRLFVDLSDQSPNIPGTSANSERRQLLEQELERRVVEVSEMASKIYDMEKQHETIMRTLNEKVVNLEAENSYMKQELKKAKETSSLQNGNISIQTSNENPVVINEFTPSTPALANNNDENKAKSLLSCEIPNSESVAMKSISPIPQNLMTESVRSIVAEANRTKAECEGTVTALEHELEIMRKWRDKQTNAADAIDPLTKNAENLLDEFYRQKIKQLSVDLRFAKGEATYYKDECTALLDGSKTMLKERAVEEACCNCSSLRDALEGTQRTFESQMRQLYEQINDRDAEIREHKDQLRVLSEGSSSSGRESSFTQNLWQMGKRKHIKSGAGDVVTKPAPLTTQIETEKVARQREPRGILKKQKLDDEYVPDKMSEKILKLAAEQRTDIEEPNLGVDDLASALKKSEFGDRAVEEDDSEVEGGDAVSRTSLKSYLHDEEAVRSGRDGSTVSRRSRRTRTESQQEELEELDSALTAGLSQNVIQMYREIGQYMSHYRSGKIPKAFKSIPALLNWEQILEFYRYYLLPRVLDDIMEFRKLNVHLFNALKKAVYKPTAFVKGILLPMCTSDSFSMIVAHVIRGVLTAVSLPVFHAATAMIKIARLPVSSPISYVLTGMINKRYTMPSLAVDALIHYFCSYDLDDEMPLSLNTCIQNFVQLYKLELTDQQKQTLIELLKNKGHKLASSIPLQELESVSVTE